MQGMIVEVKKTKQFCSTKTANFFKLITDTMKSVKI